MGGKEDGSYYIIEGYRGILGVFPPAMENHMDKKMDDEIEKLSIVEGGLE